MGGTAMLWGITYCIFWVRLVERKGPEHMRNGFWRR